MTRKNVITASALAFLLTAILLISAFLIFANETDTVTLIESGVTRWDYRLLTKDKFDSYNSSWMQPTFQTTRNWKNGTSPFGDRVDPSNGSGWEGNLHCILLITKFNIDNLELAKTKQFYANIFYDNTMTVYLNGNKVFYDSGWVDSYIDLSLPEFNNYLIQGENTLSISVCDDTGGREFDMSLYMGQKPSLPESNPGLTLSDEQLTYTELSTVYIDTDSGDYVKSRLEYVDASMHIALSDEYSEFENAYTTDEGGDIRIKGRGNSTWNNGYHDGKPNTLGGDTHTRKVPYTVKLDKKADLMGMGKSKHWVLIANYMDRTNLRNKLIYDLSGRMGMTYCKSVFVNLVLNGEYMGTYALTQKIDPEIFNGNVVDYEEAAEDFAKGVAKANGFDKNWQDSFEDRLNENLTWLTSSTFEGYKVSDYVDMSKYPTDWGYLIEYDGYADEDSFFQTDHGVPLKISNMEYIKSNAELYSYVQNYFSEFEQALFSDDFHNSKGKHYSEYVDMDSLVDYYILNALILNVEFGYKSMYMYIGPDGKLVLGPCWDYDWSSGNPFLNANGQYDHWYNDGRADNNKWYRELYGDPYFVALVKERWFSLEDALDDMMDSLDYWEDYLTPASVFEYNKFKNDPYERDFASRTGGRSYANECDQLRKFLNNRISWLNEQFKKRDPNIEGRGPSNSSNGKITLSILSGFKADPCGHFDSAFSQNIELSMKSYMKASAKIYCNGILKETVQLSYGQTVSFSAAKYAPLDGVNVVTVLLFSNGTLVDTQYYTLCNGCKKREAPDKGGYTEGYPEAPDSPPTVPDPPSVPEVTTSTTAKPITTPTTTAKPVTKPTTTTTTKPVTKPSTTASTKPITKPITTPPLTTPSITVPTTTPQTTPTVPSTQPQTSATTQKPIIPDNTDTAEPPYDETSCTSQIITTESTTVSKVPEAPADSENGNDGNSGESGVDPLIIAFSAATVFLAAFGIGFWFVKKRKN